MSADAADDLSIENLAKICRLCLKLHEFTISIYDRFDPNPNKRLFVDRLYELYNLQVIFLNF